jgi:hypothetical protein
MDVTKTASRPSTGLLGALDGTFCPACLLEPPPRPSYLTQSGENQPLSVTSYCRDLRANTVIKLC